jgi:hypothetical protein
LRAIPGTAARRAPRASAARASAAGLAVLSLLVTVALSFAAPASAKQHCWKGVVDDWLDNARVDGVYDVSCYREAIKHLPTDVKYYSSAATDIARALQAVLLDRASTHAATTETQPAVPVGPATTRKNDGGGDGGTPATTPKPSGGGPKPTGGTKTTSSVPAGGAPRSGPKVTTPESPTATPRPKPATTPRPKPTTTPRPKPATTTQATTGPLVDAINGIGPKKADSFPLPLIILAAIAGLLVAAGAAGYVVRRRQSRGLT